MDAETQPHNGDMARPRAVFSTDDFRLLRDAVAHYLREGPLTEGPDAVRLSTLHHRLGRVS